MSPWLQAVFALGFLALVVALVAALLSLRRAALRVEGVLGILDQELRPLVAETHALLADVRALTRQANREMERVGVVTERVEVVAEGLGRVVGALSGVTRLGQVLGIALGLKKGVDVFLHRLAKRQGDHHG